jgi:serine/threonine-protein kinase PRP4
MEISEPVPTPASAPEPELELDLTEGKKEEDDAAARKARRAAILAKYQADLSTKPNGTSANTPRTPEYSAIMASQVATPPPSTPYRMGTGAAPSPVPEPDEEDGQFLLMKEESTDPAKEALESQMQTDGGVTGVAAADYDPSQDMKDDVKRAAMLVNDNPNGAVEESEYEEEEEDEEDIDDMFAIDDNAEKQVKKKKKKVVKVSTYYQERDKPHLMINQKPLAIVPNIIDTAADEEGYYQVILGEFLDGGRYQVFAMVGKGMFAIVVKARVFDPAVDKEKPLGEVAIKITRSQESM